MAGPEQGKGKPAGAAAPERGRSTVKPVTVIHFPKLGRPRRPTVSVTDLKAVGRDDDATDPHVVVTPEPRVTVRTTTVAATRPSGGVARERAQRPQDTAPQGRRASVLPESHLADVDLNKPHEADELAAFGHRLFEMGKLDEARVIFEKLVSLGTTDAFVHTMLGTIYLALNDQERALALFQAALKADPDDLAAVVYRGEIRLNRGKLKLAMEDLSRAVTLAPSSDPFVERAKRLIKMGKAMGKKKK
jgi:predicted Zn-dependent protease